MLFYSRFCPNKLTPSVQPNNYYSSDYLPQEIKILFWKDDHTSLELMLWLDTDHLVPLVLSHNIICFVQPFQLVWLAKFDDPFKLMP